VLNSIEERRQFPRVPAKLAIAYEQFSGNRKIGEGRAQSVNISGRGVMMETSCPLDPETSVILWLQSPFYTLLIKGAVMHTSPVANGTYHVGIELLEVIEGEWQVLEDAVLERLQAEMEEWGK
jgi:c-di-GMP-binding flagellar brake protein YcgR